MRTIKIVIAIWALAGLLAGVFGEVSIAGDLGTTTAGFLNIGVDARALGMGGAFTSIADNPSAIYWNVAGLRNLEDPQVEFSHQSWYQDVNIENLLIAFPGRKISFGAGLTYLSFGQVQSFDEFGEQGEDLSMYNLAFAVSAAADLTEDISIGLSAKYIEQSFDIVRGSAFAGDFGIIAGYEGVRMGIALVNVGTKIRYISVEEELPAAVRMGFSFRQFNSKALFSLDGYAPFKGSFSIHQGLEVNIFEQLYARTGLIYQTQTGTDENALAYNLGLGIGYGKGRFDYTIMPSDNYGTDIVHNFTISLAW